MDPQDRFEQLGLSGLLQVRLIASNYYRFLDLCRNCGGSREFVSRAEEGMSVPKRVGRQWCPALIRVEFGILPRGAPVRADRHFLGVAMSSRTHHEEVGLRTRHGTALRSPCPSRSSFQFSGY